MFFYQSTFSCNVFRTWRRRTGWCAQKCQTSAQTNGYSGQVNIICFCFCWSTITGKYFLYLQFRLDALRHHIEQQLRMALKHRFAIGKAKNDIVSLIRFPIFSFFFLTNQTKLLILMCKHLDLWYLDIIQKQSNICFIAPPPHTTMNISFF